MPMWSAALISSALTKYSGKGSSREVPCSAWYRRKEWSSTVYSDVLPSASRFLRV